MMFEPKIMYFTIYRLTSGEGMHLLPQNDAQITDVF